MDNIINFYNDLKNYSLNDLHILRNYYKLDNFSGNDLQWIIAILHSQQTEFHTATMQGIDTLPAYSLLNIIESESLTKNDIINMAKTNHAIRNIINNPRYREYIRKIFPGSGYDLLSGSKYFEIGLETTTMPTKINIYNNKNKYQNVFELTNTEYDNWIIAYSQEITLLFPDFRDNDSDNSETLTEFGLEFTRSIRKTTHNYPFIVKVKSSNNFDYITIKNVLQAIINFNIKYQNDFDYTYFAIYYHYSGLKQIARNTFQILVK